MGNIGLNDMGNIGLREHGEHRAEGTWGTWG